MVAAREGVGEEVVAEDREEEDGDAVGAVDGGCGEGGGGVEEGDGARLEGGGEVEVGGGLGGV